MCPILFELTIMLEVSRFIFSFFSSGTQRSSPFGGVSKGNFIITSTSWYSFGYNKTTRTVIFIAQLCLLKALVESYYHLCTISFPLLIRQHTWFVLHFHILSYFKFFEMLTQVWLLLHYCNNLGIQCCRSSSANHHACISLWIWRRYYFLFIW